MRTLKRVYGPRLFTLGVPRTQIVMPGLDPGSIGLSADVIVEGYCSDRALREVLATTANRSRTLLMRYRGSRSFYALSLRYLRACERLNPG